jgi:hypothetical protein
LTLEKHDQRATCIDWSQSVVLADVLRQMHARRSSRFRRTGFPQRFYAMKGQKASLRVGDELKLRLIRDLYCGPAPKETVIWDEIDGFQRNLLVTPQPAEESIT